MVNQDIILSPIISEKSMKNADENKFTFKVSMKANKTNIKRSVEDKFKVNVLKVKTMIVKGRKTRAGKRRTEILQSAWKKAVVRVKNGQKITLFDIGGKSK